jgi:cob(I)alamin adenosyltransferase
MIGRIKIYTKTGDSGTSSLFTGEIRSKNDEIFEILGTIDELNSGIGLAREMLDEDTMYTIIDKLEKIQCVLIDIGTHIATQKRSKDEQDKLCKEFNIEGTQFVIELEKSIDELDEHLPPLHNFILPSGGQASAALHCARSICRRAERHMVPFVVDEKAAKTAGIYLNRLSDYLFTAARYVAHIQNKSETIYQKHVGRKQNVDITRL